MTYLIWFLGYFLFGIAIHETAKMFLIRWRVLTKEQADQKNTWAHWILAGLLWPFILVISLISAIF